MSDQTTTSSGSTRPAREAEHRERAAEIGGERPEATLAATNGPDLALRSPAPMPAPDQDEQLVVVRRAIYDARTQAVHWRQVTGVDDASEMASRRDRDADVLEHVLRRLISPPFSEDVGLFVQVAGEQQKQYVRFEITTDGRIVLRALALEGQPRIVDVDLVTATERLLRYPL